MNEVPSGGCAALLDMQKGTPDGAYELHSLWVSETELCGADEARLPSEGFEGHGEYEVPPKLDRRPAKHDAPTFTPSSPLAYDGGPEETDGELAAHEAALLVCASFADLRGAEIRLPARTPATALLPLVRHLTAALGFLTVPGGGQAIVVLPPPGSAKRQ